jgi:hypothetical protein
MSRVPYRSFFMAKTRQTAKKSTGSEDSVRRELKPKSQVESASTTPEPAHSTGESMEGSGGLDDADKDHKVVGGAHKQVSPTILIPFF